MEGHDILKQDPEDEQMQGSAHQLKSLSFLEIKKECY